MNEITKLLENGPTIINIGLKSFHDANQLQSAESNQVNWSPPAQGDKVLIDLLDKLI